MNVWWKEEPLSRIEELLFARLFNAHYFSAFRENASTTAVINSAAAGGDLAKAIASGLLTLGGRHAPIKATCELLSWDNPAEEARHFLKWGKRVPGWGGTFQKDKPDPLWKGVDQAITDHYPFLALKLGKVTEELHKCGILIFPNPSAYTAASAIALGLSYKGAVYLFIRARLDAWSKIALDYLE